MDCPKNLCVLNDSLKRTIRCFYMNLLDVSCVRIVDISVANLRKINGALTLLFKNVIATFFSFFPLTPHFLYFYRVAVFFSLLLWAHTKLSKQMFSYF